MGEFGLNVKHDTGAKRIEIECKHQNGLLYVVRSEANWVCSEDLIHAHSLAGFFKELEELNDPRTAETMRRWGIYFRPRPLASEDETSSEER